METGIEAARLCRNTNDLDIILMGVQMLGLDGFEANCQVRKFNKDVVMIAQTANAFSGDKEKALEADCNDYVSKPINEGVLLEKIQEWVNI